METLLFPPTLIKLIALGKLVLRFDLSVKICEATRDLKVSLNFKYG